MKRIATVIAGLAMLATACQVQPLSDPGLGDLGLTSIVFAADGSILAQWHAEENRVLVEYAELPLNLIDAVVGIEDERYWLHPGVDLRAVARAIVANVETGDVVQGASTITQQYLKNVVLTPEVTLDRKLNEAALALRLEESLTKEEILERYMNTVYLGSGAYGMGTAASHYFGKSVSDLTLAESALLAGLIQAPSSTAPYVDPDAALDRRRVVLEKLLDLGWITQGQAEEANHEPLALQPRLAEDRARYPYFVEEVKRRLLDDPALGETPTDRYNALFRGGLRIYTTLEPAIQEAAEAAVVSIFTDGGPASALAAIDPRTGYVKALVGGWDFYDADDPVAQFNLATQGRRQTGSSFKTFALAAAVENGWSLEEILPGNRSIVIETDSGPWTVENYNGSTFPDLSLLEATVFSVNVAYADLVDRLGPQAVVEAAGAAGILSELAPLHSVVLGAQEASPLEMASAYATFAADGIHIEPILVTAIERTDGVNVWEAVPVITEAFTRDVARQVTAALTEVVRRGTGREARIGRPIAGKTGTSQEHHDAWFVGYTPELSAAVWVGYPQAQVPMVPPRTPYSISGGTWPAQVWARFAAAALTGTAYGDLARADLSATVAVEVDLSTGFLAGPLCPRAHVHRVQLPADQVPTVICPIHNPPELSGIGAGEVPDVIGLSLSEAVARLTLADYQIRVRWEDGGSLAPGTVFGQDPPSGVAAQTGSAVWVTVAGPEPGTVVPSVLGLPVASATTQLEEIGLDVIVITQSESDPADAVRRSGLVWKQSPAGDAPAEGTVTVWVNP